MWSIVLTNVYLLLALIAVLYFVVDFFFCTSKHVFVSTNGKFYKRMIDNNGVHFWRPVKKFIFKNVFRYILADDETTLPDLIPYKEWLKQNDR